MRVKVIRWTDPTSSVAKLVVMRWSIGQWEPVMNFGLHESEQAHEFAMKLSLTKREPIELAVFEDGEKLSRGCDANDADHSYNSIRNRDQKSESQP